MKKVLFVVLFCAAMVPAMAQAAGKDKVLFDEKKFKIELLTERLRRLQTEQAFLRERSINLQREMQATLAELNQLRAFVVDTTKPPETGATPAPESK
ncbi:MAG: hypothetical protein JRJ54_13620 [Deltaproteobacteria bacterium]|nr:hypothetical protein [Deltaproteobacteria bacterium]